MNPRVFLIIFCSMIIYPLGIAIIINDGSRFMSLLLIIVMIMIPLAIRQANKEELLTN